MFHKNQRIGVGLVLVGGWIYAVGGFCGFLPIQPDEPHEYTVLTVAGGNGIGHQDGPGTEATFFRNEAIAVAPDGSIYVGDTENRLLRRVSPDGRVTTVAGQPRVREVIDGRGSEAAFGELVGWRWRRMARCMWPAERPM